MATTVSPIIVLTEGEMVTEVFKGIIVGVGIVFRELLSEQEDKNNNEAKTIKIFMSYFNKIRTLGIPELISSFFKEDGKS